MNYKFICFSKIAGSYIEKKVTDGKNYSADIMSVSTSNEYKRLRRSHSLPHITSRYDSGASGITATTHAGTGSCSLLDQIDYDSAMCNEHQFNNQTRHYNKVKYNHNYHHHNHHQQYETVRQKSVI